MKLNSFSLAVIVVVLLFGGIVFSDAMGWWQTETNKTPATYTVGEAAGEYNPADIRGSYTFGDVSELFEIPLSDLQAAFRLPADRDPAAYPLKELEAVTADLPVEIGTASVRMFTAFYKGLPYDLAASEESYLFPEAGEVLKARGRMLPEQAAYLETHLVSDQPVEEAPAQSAPAGTPTIPVQAAAVTQPAPDATEHVQPEKMVAGKTTFQDLLDWGVSQAAVEQVIGETMPAPQTVIKDFLTQKGIEFSTIKPRLQTEVDKVN